MKVSITKFIFDKIKRSLAIVQDTDTATRNIAKDKFVNWKGNIYTANQAIASGSTLSAASGGNLTACDDGALNEIGNDITAINSNITVLQNSVPNKYLDGIEPNSSVSFTISNSSRIALFAFGNSTSRMSIWNIYTSSSGVVTIGEMSNGGNVLSITSTGNNSITLTNTGGTVIYVMFLVFGGSITVND